MMFFYKIFSLRKRSCWLNWSYVLDSFSCGRNGEIDTQKNGEIIKNKLGSKKIKKTIKQLIVV